MKLNDEYKPKDCCDISDIKAGLNKLHQVSSDTNKKPVVRRICMYQEKAEQFDPSFSAFLYFSNL